EHSIFPMPVRSWHLCAWPSTPWSHCCGGRPRPTVIGRQAIDSARVLKQALPVWKGRAIRFVRAPRFSIEIPFYFRQRGEDSWREGMTDNISRSGVLFRTPEMLEE